MLKEGFFNAQFIMHNVQWWDASSCVISQLDKARQEIFPPHLSCSTFAT